MTTVDIGSLAAWRDTYLRAHTEMKRWEAIKEQAKEKIKTHLEDHDADTGTLNGVEAVRIASVAGRFDSKRFREVHPDLYHQFTGPGSTRFEVVSDG